MDESRFEEIYENFNSNSDSYSSNDTYADSGIDGESPEIYEMNPPVLLLSIILLGSLLYHFRLLHPFFLSLYNIVFSLYSCYSSPIFLSGTIKKRRCVTESPLVS